MHRLTLTRAIASSSTDRLARSGRLEFLDSLRGVAVMAVFLSHMLTDLLPGYRHFQFHYMELGTFGLNLFFLCSGFIIPVSLERAGSLGRFWVRRIFRLYPLFWLSVGLLTACYLLVPSASSRATARVPEAFASDPLGVVLANLTMLPTFFGFPLLSSVYWSLAYEMIFYVLVSLLFAAGVIRRTVPITLVVIALTAICEIVLPLTVGPRIPLGATGTLLTMFAGTVFYRLHSGELAGRSAALLVGVSLGVLVTTGLVNPPGGAGAVPNLYLITGWIASFAVFGLFYLLQARRLVGALVPLGLISYSVYLLHPLALALVIPFGTVWTTMTVLMLLVLAASTLAYRWVELPAIRLGQRLSAVPSVKGDRRA